MKKAASTANSGQRKTRKAFTEEAREKQLVARAMDLAEQKLMDGTASSQLITHFLKIGSTRETIEKEILGKQKELVEAKTQSLQSSRKVEELYANALNAMRRYSGQGSEEDEYEED